MVNKNGEQETITPLKGLINKRQGNKKIPILGSKMYGLHSMMEHTQDVMEYKAFTRTNPSD